MDDINCNTVMLAADVRLDSIQQKQESQLKFTVSIRMHMESILDAVSTAHSTATHHLA